MWWWFPHGTRVVVVQTQTPPVAGARLLDRPAVDEAEALAIARGMALAEAEGRSR